MQCSKDRWSYQRTFIQTPQEAPRQVHLYLTLRLGQLARQSDAHSPAHRASPRATWFPTLFANNTKRVGHPVSVPILRLSLGCPNAWTYAHVRKMDDKLAVREFSH
jgi:hypothetical protein